MIHRPLKMITALLLLTAVIVAQCGCTAQTAPEQPAAQTSFGEDWLLNTYCYIQTYEARQESLIRQAFSVARDFENRLSRTIATSDIGRFNASESGCTVEKPWAVTGTNMARKHNIINSLYLDPEELEKTNFERFERYRYIEEHEARCERYMMDDAEYCVVAFGIAARVSKNAVSALRKQGIKVGLIRPITIWPFPKQAIAEAAEQVRAFVSVELSMGQMIEDIRLAEQCRRPVTLCNRAGGMIPTPEQIMEAVKRLEGGNA